MIRAALRARRAFAILAAALAAAPSSATLPFVPIVFFDSGDARPGIVARAVLDASINSFLPAIQHGPGELSVAGYTDRVGSDAANIRLSRERAEAVRDYLVSRGILRDRIVIHACGERLPLVETTDETPEIQNRRVEVSWGAVGSFPHSCEQAR